MGRAKKKIYGEKFWGVRSLVHEKEVHILPREKERKERKVGARFSVSSLEF